MVDKKMAGLMDGWIDTECRYANLLAVKCDHLNIRQFSPRKSAETVMNKLVQFGYRISNKLRLQVGPCKKLPEITCITYK